MKTVFTNEEAVKAFGEGNSQARNSTGSIFAEGYKLFSYGYHFTLAVRLDGLYLINADRYSVTTSRHTSYCIQYLTPNIQIPFSALRVATIDPLIVKVIDNKPDQYTQEKRKDKDGHEYIADVHHLGGVLFEAKGSQYLSGFDSQESFNRHAYFLTRLDGQYSSYDEAIEGLKPDEVKQAIARGEDVKRQGEWFFIKTSFTPKEVKGAIKLGRVYPIVADGTHTATEVREVNGERIVKGIIRHVRREHKMLNLGEGWFKPVKNTALESYTAGGNVD